MLRMSNLKRMKVKLPQSYFALVQHKYFSELFNIVQFKDYYLINCYPRLANTDLFNTEDRQTSLESVFKLSDGFCYLYKNVPQPYETSALIQPWFSWSVTTQVCVEQSISLDISLTSSDKIQQSLETNDSNSYGTIM